jgi:hypothetical protein
MPETQAQATQPAPDAPTVPEDLSSHLSTLIDAMRQLAESHRTLLETVRTEKKGSGVGVQGSGKESSEPAATTTDSDISGDPGSGQKPGAVVDYSRLSPLQSITLGLRDSRGTKVPSAGAD